MVSQRVLTNFALVIESMVTEERGQDKADTHPESLMPTPADGLCNFDDDQGGDDRSGSLLGSVRPVRWRGEGKGANPVVFI